MTEEKKEVYEIKKESVKQFFIISGGVFVGCFLAIVLAGQLLKPKAPCPCVRGFIAPPHYAKMQHYKHYGPKFEHRRDRISHLMKKKDAKLDTKVLSTTSKELDTPAK